MFSRFAPSAVRRAAPLLIRQPQGVLLSRSFASSSKNVFDATNSTFDSLVLKSDKPVIVDLHAAWCGPCRVLGPKLEKLVDAADGAISMAKVDVDKEDQIAADHNVSSIPAVFAYHKGKVIGNFTGLSSDADLSRFVEMVKSKAK
eukprot:TRINITY_DN3176_c0_g1_i1.p1 TRINITY_DN3176_c0_g1~~TRINITY_DN3176_c0_g1_i1.p1  ORF type:complete len:152 (-),score=33.55 TRINITY_DN3176_c0_g1_i1:32-466(-)